MNSIAAAGGLFGPPQTVSKEAGGLNTAFGYLYHEDTFKNHTDHVIRQNQVYSQVGYSASSLWEIYGRLGVTDLKISDVFSSTSASTTSIKSNFEENLKFFGTLGAKGFCPINPIFGIGAFLQASYNFSNYSDDTAGYYNAMPYIAELKIKNLWDVNFGISIQATIPYGIKLYTGPFIYYAQTNASLSANIPGLPFGTKGDSLHNRSIGGGLIGADIPLIKGFRLNIEGQYTDRFSVGSAVTYTY